MKHLLKSQRRYLVVITAALVLGHLQAPHAQEVDLESNLEVYYTFDEGKADAAGDVSGNFRPATIFNDPQFADSQILWETGVYGGGVNMDATYFLAAHDWFGIGGTGARTISMWVNTGVTPNSQTVLVGWGPNVNQQRWHFKYDASGAIRTENQGGNNFGGIVVSDGAWHHVVSVFPEGGAVIGDVDHYVDGVLDTAKNGGITNPVNTVADPSTGIPVTIGGSPFGGGFRFATSLIDDVRVYSRALTPEEIAALAAGQGVIEGAPPIITAPAGLQNNYFVDATTELAFGIEGVNGAAVDIGSIVLMVNGVDATSDLTIDASGQVVAANYSNLEANQNYAIELIAADENGLKGKRSLSFSTYLESNFVIEAEDYNFGGGQFINDPIPCRVLGGTDGCYFDRVSIPGIDSFDINGFADDDNSNFDLIYRFAAIGSIREEEFDTHVSADAQRSKYVDAGVDEYEIDLLNAGDWANYTRQFPDEPAFRVLLRAQSSSAQTIHLERVTSAPTAADQEVEFLGAFVLSPSSSYGFVDLTDLTGDKAISVELTGQETIRLSFPEANADVELNYMMFIPAEESTIVPTISITSPEADSLHASDGSITIEVTADDEDGFVEQVEYFAESLGGSASLGVVTEGNFSFTWENVAAGVYTLTAVATDNDGLSATSAPIRVIVDSDAPEITAVRGSSAGDAIEIIFNEALDQASAETITNYSIEPYVGIVSAVNSGQRVILTTDAQTAGGEYTVTVQNISDAHGVVQAEDSGSFIAIDAGLAYGLELYWTFDEGSGETAMDMSGFGRHAVMFDDPALLGQSIVWSEGQFGGSIDFTGGFFLEASDYYGIGGASPRTISMWLKTDLPITSGATALMGWGVNANEQRWHFKFEASNDALRVENQGGNAFGDTAVTDGEWHHVVALFPEGGTVIGDTVFYIDGTFEAAPNGGVSNPVNTNVDPSVAAPVTVGGAPLGAALRFATAVLDDVRLYSRALSEAEIQALAQGEGVVDGGGADQPQLTIMAGASNSVVISWTGGGVLQTTSALGGDWEIVVDAQNPHEVTIEESAYFRVIVP